MCAADRLRHGATPPTPVFWAPQRAALVSRVSVGPSGQPQAPWLPAGGSRLRLLNSNLRRKPNFPRRPPHPSPSPRKDHPLRLPRLSRPLFPVWGQRPHAHHGAAPSSPTVPSARDRGGHSAGGRTHCTPSASQRNAPRDCRKEPASHRSLALLIGRLVWRP